MRATTLVLGLVLLTFAVSGAAQAWYHQECDARGYPSCCDTGPDHLPIGFGSRGNTICTPTVVDG